MAAPKPRVFISSLIQGHGDVRRAAAEAIKRADCEPVRAEDFPASSTSPRTACLDGVASSDAVCLLLGKRYLAEGGSLVPSGLSATHEEYNEAVRLRKPLLAFLDYRDDTPTEPAQQEFINQVTGYVVGHWRKTFRTLDELGALLETALKEAEPMMSSSGAAGGSGDRLNAAFEAELPRGDHIAWLHVVWATLRNEEVVDPLLLTDPAYERKLQEFAHTGTSPLFSYNQPKSRSANPSRLRIVQGEPEDRRGADEIVVVDVYEHGTLSIALNAANSRRGSGGLDDYAVSRYITPDQVKTHLEQAWGFAARWWDDQDAYLRHANLEFNAALRNIGMRLVGAVPPQRGSGNVFYMPNQKTPDPLWAYERPRKIGRQDLTSPVSEIDRIVRLLVLRFEEAQK
jgi:hypothetical protein